MASQVQNDISRSTAELEIGRSTNDCCDLPWRIGSDCECADSLDGAIYCDSSELFIESRFCMAYDEIIKWWRRVHTLTLPSIIRSYISTYGLYIKLPNTFDEIENAACGSINREGLFCTKCKENHSLSMYPYLTACVECDPNHYVRNWMFYVALSCGPLTLFLILVICLRISVTSAPMTTFVFVSQIVSLPPFQRGFISTINVSHLSEGAKVLLGILYSLYGIWNLDFFTALSPPFCLPNQSVYSVTYMEAVYPLILLVSVYVLVQLHSKNFKPLVWLWAPFKVCYTRFRRQWDIKSSIVDAFATFLLLSNVKFLFVSADILAPTRILSRNGSTLAIASYTWMLV